MAPGQHMGDPGASDGFVDLRSDTVTRPTPEMRAAMASAEVGDDLYGEDPTVNELQHAYAERVGKDAALYVPSGTMANQLALRVLATPGTLVVAPRGSHVVAHENGAGPLNAGVQLHVLDAPTGTIDADEVRWVLEAADHHQPRTSLLWIENTHMPASGAPWSSAALHEIGAIARSAGLPLHVDGARLFNASVATGMTAAEIVAPATTVMSCLSKGLAAPVGSLLAGPRDVIDAARAERSRLGGGMRQAGVIAAAGLVALATMVERLADDHARAALLAAAVAERFGDIGFDPETVRTNIVCFAPPDARAFLEHLQGEGVRAGTIAPGIVRLVTHHDVDDEGIERARKAIATAP